MPAPQPRSAADVISAHPVEALDLAVEILDVVDEQWAEAGCVVWPCFSWRAASARA
jgi:hypothetical protein